MARDLYHEWLERLTQGLGAALTAEELEAVTCLGKIPPV